MKVRQRGACGHAGVHVEFQCRQEMPSRECHAHVCGARIFTCSVIFSSISSESRAIVASRRILQTSASASTHSCASLMSNKRLRSLSAAYTRQFCEWARTIDEWVSQGRTQWSWRGWTCSPSEYGELRFSACPPRYPDVGDSTAHGGTDQCQRWTTSRCL